MNRAAGNQRARRKNIMKSIAENRDCMEAMAQMPDKAFDLAIVDPPYGVGSFHDHETTSRPYNRVWSIGWNDDVPTADYFNELYRVADQVIIWGVNYYSQYVRETGRIVWDKGNASGIGSDCELASQPKDRRVVKVTIQNTGFVGEARGQKIHPCQKPVALYRWLLTNYAKPGDTILDTHLGSGSSRIAAYDLGFDFTGYELDPDYFAAQEERFKTYLAQPKLFPPDAQNAEAVDLFAEMGIEL